MDDERACASLCSRYAVYADRFRERVAGLFAEDATLILHGETLAGRAAIAEYFKPRSAVVTLHYCTNIVVEIESATTACGTAHLLSFGSVVEDGAGLPLPMPVPRSGGIYDDRYVRVGGTWLFQSRRLELVFRGQR